MRLITVKYEIVGPERKDVPGGETGVAEEVWLLNLWRLSSEVIFSVEDYWVAKQYVEHMRKKK